MKYFMYQVECGCRACWSAEVGDDVLLQKGALGSHELVLMFAGLGAARGLSALSLALSSECSQAVQNLGLF